MHNILISIIFTFLFSFQSFADSTTEKEQVQNYPLHPIFPVFSGAALITWGVYELGEDAEEGRRNISILWGSTVVASAGIILYQFSRDKGKGAEIVLQSAKNKEPSIAFNYRL